MFDVVLLTQILVQLHISDLNTIIVVIIIPLLVMLITTVT